jgi:hypothetical protein
MTSYVIMIWSLLPNLRIDTTGNSGVGFNFLKRGNTFK